MDLIEIRNGRINCLRCGSPRLVGNLELIGPHVCSHGRCDGCSSTILQDLPFAHGAYYPTWLDAERHTYAHGSEAADWYCQSLLNSWNRPNLSEPPITIEVRTHIRGDVVFLPCIDFLYGHALLKLLQAQEHIQRGHQLIILVPTYLRWMVPENAAEIWTVDIPLRDGREYFPSLSRRVQSELLRFPGKVYLSPGKCHPRVDSPELFTKVPPFIGGENQKNITYVWRDDRLWVTNLFESFVSKHSVVFGRQVQRKNIINAFRQLQKKLDTSWSYSVVGLGEIPNFPKWIRRIPFPKRLTDADEVSICQLYANSPLVIGVHGSNMLMPSWHCGSVIDLMPLDRWGNIAQDILYRFRNPRVSANRIRYIPISTDPKQVGKIAATLLSSMTSVEKHYVDECFATPQMAEEK